MRRYGANGQRATASIRHNMKRLKYIPQFFYCLCYASCSLRGARLAALLVADSTTNRHNTSTVLLADARTQCNAHYHADAGEPTCDCRSPPTPLFASASTLVAAVRRARAC
jgi:hypothetical protein